jgi:hypothetical protein
VSPELLTLLTVVVAVLGAIACALIRARAAREGHLADVAREIIRWWCR